MAKTVIGFCGFARSGKNTAADYLVREYGFTLIAFADPMREFLYAMNPIVAAVANSATTTKYVRVQDVINEVGWDGYKATPYGQEIRELLQREGTNAGRKVLGDTVWMDEIMKRIRRAKGHVVISDVRFEDECDFIRNLGGEVIRVNRPGITSVNDHISDRRLPDASVDFEVENDDTIEALELKIEAILSSQLGFAV